MTDRNAKCFRITHCIFDMDGTLLDTERLYTETTQKILGRYGKEMSWEFKMSIMGLQTPEASKRIVKEFELPMTPEEYTAEQKAMNQELMANAELLPGVQRLLCHLHNHKIPMALATSSPEDMMQIKTKNHKALFDLFHHKVCGSTDPEVKNGKPAPDIFLVAAARFCGQVCPQNCLVFEDSPMGVQAGYCAGMPVVMVPDPRVPKAQTAKATRVLNSMEDFCPEEFCLPPFQCNV